MAVMTPFGTRISAVAIGTVLEFYDFAVFGSLVDVIGELFFPNTSPMYSLLASLSVFGSAFLMRPLGGLFLGIIGDTVGRQRALEISILLMLLPSFFIGCLPTYAVGGIYSTIILVILRLLQGLAVGGEMVGAFVFTVESTGGDSPGFWGSLMKSTSLIGNALGLGVATTLRHVLTEEEFYSWGWRVPFFLALGLAILGLHLRRGMVPEKDTAENAEDKESESFSCSGLMSQWRELLVVSAVVALWAVGYYTCFVWLVYFNSTLMFGGAQTVVNAWWINLAMSLVLVCLFPLAGLLGDAVTAWYGDSNKLSTSGYRAVMVTGAALLVICSIPSFYLIAKRELWSVCAGYFMFAVALALFGGNMPVYLVYKFPPSARYTGVGLGYNIANAIFASSAAVVMTTLSIWDNVSESKGLFPSLYLSGIAFFSFLTLLIFDPFLVSQLDKSNKSNMKPSAPTFTDTDKKNDMESMDTSDCSSYGGESAIDVSARSTTNLIL